LTLYTYLASRNRFGVVDTDNMKNVKGCFIITLPEAGPVPPTLLKLEANLSALGRTDTLLCMIVRKRRDREGGTVPTAVDLPTPKASPVLPPSVMLPAPYRQPVPADTASPSLETAQRRPAVSPPAVTMEDDEPYEPDDEEPYVTER
jgi:hypothetical protein